MNTEEEILATRERKKEFAKKVAAYIEEHDHFDVLDKEQVIALAVYTMTQDIGLAQDFLAAIGVDLDLYAYDFAKKEPEATKARTRRYVYTVPFAELLNKGFEFQQNMRRTLTDWGFQFDRPITWTDDMEKEVRIYVQEQEEVSDADRAERTPEGSDQVSKQREDPVWRSGKWEDGHYSGVLRRERDT